MSVVIVLFGFSGSVFVVFPSAFILFTSFIFSFSSSSFAFSDNSSVLFVFTMYFSFTLSPDFNSFISTVFAPIFLMFSVSMSSNSPFISSVTFMFFALYLVTFVIFIVYIISSPGLYTSLFDIFSISNPFSSAFIPIFCLSFLYATFSCFCASMSPSLYFISNSFISLFISNPSPAFTSFI